MLTLRFVVLPSHRYRLYHPPNMGKRLPNPTAPSRYDYGSVVEEIDRVLDKMPRGTYARCARAAGMDHTGFSHRLNETHGTRFSYEQIGAVAEEIQAPIAWPFVAWEVGTVLEAFLKGRSKVGKKPKP